MGITAIVFSVGVGLLSPRVIGKAVDSLTGGFDSQVILRYVVALVVITLVQGLFNFSQRWVLVGLSRDVEYEIREDYFAALIRQPQSFYHRSYTGDLMARATNDLAAVRMVCGPAIMYSTSTLLTAIGAGTLMFNIHPGLTLWALSPLPFVALVTRLVGRRIHDLFARVQEQFSAMSTLVQENLGGVRVLRAYAREQSEIVAFEKSNTEYLGRQRQLIRWNAAFHPVLQLLVGLGFALVLWRGVDLVRAGEMTVGQLVSFHFFFALLVWPMIAIGWVINMVERGRASMRRIQEIIETKAEIFDRARAKNWGLVQGELEFRSLRFAYQDETPMLKDISLSISTGSTVAVVGATGSGKSTLLNLISRTFEPAEGMVFLDGHDVLDWQLEALRRSVAVVPQESFLFSSSVRANILWGAPDAPSSALDEAVEIAGLLPDLERLPQGLETRIGERGVTLSGGQRQRVAIARAVLRQGRILLLDDCLSAVDSETESRILRRLTQHFEGRTVLIVSHRVTAAQTADLVVVLDQGRIVERGTPDDLMHSGGLYSDLYRRQQLERELRAV